MTPNTIMWIILLLVFAVGEGVTVGLTSIWFAVGALGGVLASAMGAGQWVQLGTFIALSAICLVLLRPMAKKMIVPKAVATNADRIIGETAIVTEEIDNLKGVGLATVGGQAWTARSEGNEVIPAGALAEVVRIEGVKIIVKAQESATK